ncbi:MAG: phosphoadenylyl-sulfate reductase [Thermodesulfobacteriota bacterium]
MVVDVTDKALLEKLNSMEAEELIRWAFDEFGERAAIGTSFQLSGSVMVDMAAGGGKKFRVFTVDTGRLHPETCRAIADAEERYGIKVERFLPDERRVKEMVDSFGEYLFFTDRAGQEFCCNVRKVEPNRRALATLDVWITGLRRDQSKYRREVEKAAFVREGDRDILKLCPLASWDMERVWKYVREKGLPYNKLFDKGYDSVGCVICSTPLLKGEEPRSGRWRWFNEDDDKKECGIHFPGENDKTEKGGSE